jgi:hypothetical protein
MRRFRPAALLALAFVVTCVSLPASAQEAAEKPAAAWKPFQEFGFLTGSWSGTAESGSRVGGRVSRFATEMGGNFLVHRGTTVFPAQAGSAEDSTEEVGYYSYDRERRKYVATYFFSTGIVGHFDVEIPSDGNVRLVSTSLLNYDNGARMRMTLGRKSDAELAMQIEVAPSGKDFVSYVTSRMTKK